MENRQHLVTETGTRDSLTWEFDGIRMGHAVSSFQNLTTFSASSAVTEVVRLHIGLRGNYSFQTTVFGYLAEQRLLLARQYLLDTRKTAAEIAAQLGYATPQHFNNAFKKRFGAPPRKIRKNP